MILHVLLAVSIPNILLVSDFFHVNQGVLCLEHAEQASSNVCKFEGGGVTGLLNKGGGSNRLPAQVQTSYVD